MTAKTEAEHKIKQLEAELRDLDQQMIAHQKQNEELYKKHSEMSSRLHVLRREVR